LVESITKSAYLSHAINKEDLSIKFEVLFQEPSIQSYFVDLNTDIISQQIIMSHALLGLENGVADFKDQKATVKPLSQTNLLFRDLSQTRSL
jgi:hypothetical protein